MKFKCTVHKVTIFGRNISVSMCFIRRVTSYQNKSDKVSSHNLVKSWKAQCLSFSPAMNATWNVWIWSSKTILKVTFMCELSHEHIDKSICSMWFVHMHFTICMCRIFLFVQFEMSTFEKLYCESCGTNLWLAVHLYEL